MLQNNKGKSETFKAKRPIVTLMILLRYGRSFTFKISNGQESQRIHPAQFSGNLERSPNETLDAVLNMKNQLNETSQLRSIVATIKSFRSNCFVFR